MPVTTSEGVLVPIEPTVAMIDAWADASPSTRTEGMTDAEANAAWARAEWSAMLAAAPAADSTCITEAIRKAKVEADKTYGIAWHHLEEVSRVELILAALSTTVTPS